MVVVKSEIDSKIKLIQEWIKENKHLPQKIGKVLIKRYIDCCNGDVEETKKLLELSYTMRNKNPNIFFNRDPMDPKTQLAFKVTDVISLQNPTPENYNIFFCRLNEDFDINLIDFDECAKASFMLLDSLSALPFKEEGDEIADGEIPIFDMAGVTWKHLTKVILSTLKIGMKYAQEAHCIRLKQIHVINCSPMLEKIMFLIKPFVKTEFYEMLNFHLPDSDTLDKFVPKELLPNEYGGKAGSIVELKAECLKRVEGLRNYLMDDKCWKVDDSKRKIVDKPMTNFKAFDALDFNTLSFD